MTDAQLECRSLKLDTSDPTKWLCTGCRKGTEKVITKTILKSQPVLYGHSDEWPSLLYGQFYS